MKQLPLTLIILLVSCTTNDWCGEVKLGNRFTLIHESPRQIIFCTSNKKCCNSGWIAVPSTVTEYGFDQNWIIAKTKNEEYWIINKNFEIDLSKFDVPGRYEFYQSHITGNLTAKEFHHIKDSLNIDIDFTQIN